MQTISGGGGGGVFLYRSTKPYSFRGKTFSRRHPPEWLGLSCAVGLNARFYAVNQSYPRQGVRSMVGWLVGWFVGVTSSTSPGRCCYLCCWFKVLGHSTRFRSIVRSFVLLLSEVICSYMRIALSRGWAVCPG